MYEQKWINDNFKEIKLIIDINNESNQTLKN